MSFSDCFQEVCEIWNTLEEGFEQVGYSLELRPVGLGNVIFGCTILFSCVYSIRGMNIMASGRGGGDLSARPALVSSNLCGHQPHWFTEIKRSFSKKT